MHDTYSLRLYDTELIKFTLFNDDFGLLNCRILKVQNDLMNLMPLDLELSENGILKWINRRVIPKNRIFVNKILSTLGLSRNNPKAIIDVCKGLSLNDSYWIVPDGFEGRFDKYNLYENRFSEMLALVAYTGVGQTHEAFTTSPELTTNGMLPKAWRLIENEGIFLYKGGTSGTANSGREPYSEFYASQIAEKMGLNSVHYDLENWKGMTASKCRLFTDINTSYIPIGYIAKSGNIRECIEYYESLGEEFSQHIRSMLVLDCVIFNEDRHFGNFGLLRDNHTGKIISPAPIFDNGMSLFCFADNDEYNDLENYSKTRLPAYDYITFEQLFKAVARPAQIKQLRKLINFKFIRHPNINLPEEHLKSIEKFINTRVNYLLSLRRASENY